MVDLEDTFLCAPVAMALVDFDGHIIRVNEAFCRLTGLTADELGRRLFQDIWHAGDGDVDIKHFQNLLGGRSTEYRVEKRYIHPADGLRWVLLTVSLLKNRESVPSCFIVQLQDVSEQKLVEERLTYLAHHDHLTGLFNRRYFECAFADAIERATDLEDRGAVAFVDLDRFKEINDQFGHQTGDAVLKAVAAALSARVGERGTLARLGGDEFGVILPSIEGDTVGAVAADIVDAVRSQTGIGGPQTLALTASVGIALFSQRDRTHLLAGADRATYEAKRSGGDRWAVYQPERDTTASSLAVAIKRGNETALSIERRALGRRVPPTMLRGARPRLAVARGLIVKHWMAGAACAALLLLLARVSLVERPGWEVSATAPLSLGVTETRAVLPTTASGAMLAAAPGVHNVPGVSPLSFVPPTPSDEFEWLSRRLSQLGVKPGARASAVGIEDRELLGELQQSIGELWIGRIVDRSDLIFVGALDESALTSLATLKSALSPRGALWVIHPTGRHGLSRRAVIAAGRTAGLRLRKTVSVSSKHAAVQLVPRVS